jgi:hypothetical protein
MEELINSDWSAAFRRNQSATFQARLDLLMERDRLVARIRAILDQPPPLPPVRDRVIGLLQLLGFGACALVGSVAVSLLGMAALQWLAVTPLAMGLLLLLWAGLNR